MFNKLAIFGTSGFAYEVADVAYALGINDIVLLSNSSDATSSDVRISIVPESKVEYLKLKGYRFAIGVGDSNVRKKIYQKNNECIYPNLIHPNATLGYGQYEAIEKSIGNIITAGAVFTNNIRVGNFGVYNLNCTVGHDCCIGDYVSIMPSVNISGNVDVKEGVLIGVGAIILQGSLEKRVIIGSNSTVGAGSVVTKNVDAGLTVVGIPARAIRKKI